MRLVDDLYETNARVMNNFARTRWRINVYHGNGEGSIYINPTWNRLEVYLGKNGELPPTKGRRVEKALGDYIPNLPGGAGGVYIAPWTIRTGAWVSAARPRPRPPMPHRAGYRGYRLDGS